VKQNCGFFVYSLQNLNLQFKFAKSDLSPTMEFGLDKNDFTRFNWVVIIVVGKT